MAQLQTTAAQKGIQLVLQGDDSQGPWDAPLVTLAINGLRRDAFDFAAADRGDAASPAPERARQRPGRARQPAAPPGRWFFTTPRPNGERSDLGLGLSIVQRIMLLHGGRLQFANTQPGLRASLDFSAQG